MSTTIRRRSTRSKAVWPWIAISTIMVFLYLPILLIGLLSFNASQIAALPIDGLTTDWYRDLLTDERFVNAAILSLKVGAISTAIAVPIGTTAALAVSQSASRLSKGLGLLWLAPLVVPALVLAIAIASTFRLLEIRLSFWTLVAGHVVVNAPLVYLILLARLKGFNWSLTEAARTLGATPLTAFRKITAPLLLPAILGSAILCFAISLDNFVVSLFLTGGDSTLPLLMWSLMREGFRPTINALATLLLAVTVIAAVAAERLAARATR